MRRTVLPELLDSDSGTPEEVRASLADLQRVNRWFGGARTTSRLLEQVALKAHLRSMQVLDVAGATGDILASATEHLRQKGIELKVALLDRAASHLNGKFAAVLGDALALPFADESFDVVSCSLFIHHLEPEQTEQFVRESLRVARIALVINDLRRDPFHLALVYAGLPLFSRLTRHDAPVSVRRAYTPAEVEHMLRRSGASSFEISHYYLYRMGVIAWKRD